MSIKGLVCGQMAGILIAAGCSAAVGQEAASSFAATGRLAGAGDTILMGSAATGVVAALNVSEGERVKAGQVLLSLDCRPIEVAIKVREHEAAEQEAVLKRVKNGYRVEEIAIAAAAVKAAEAVAAEAATARQRAVSLKVDNTATQARIDAAERDARTSAARLEEARQRLSLEQTGSRPEDIEEATARRDAAKAAVAQTRARFDQCFIRSPIDGVVLSTNVTAGRFVSDVNQGPLLRLVDDSKRRARVDIDEKDLAQVCVGQRAAIKSDAYPGQRLNGTVASLGSSLVTRRMPGADPADQRMREVREAVLELDPADPKWPIGLTVTVAFTGCDRSGSPDGK